MITNQNNFVAVHAITRWRVPVQLVGILMLTAGLFYSTTLDLFSLWNDTSLTTYTHGWLVLLVSGWWLVDVSNKQTLHTGPSITGMLVYVLLALLWLFARNANIQIVQFALLPALAAALMWSLLGTTVATIVAMPLAYLYFAIPLWDFINPILQWATVFAVRGLVALVGIPATFESNIVHLQAGSFVIEGGCGGLHYVMVGLALAVLYSHVYQTKRRMRLIYLALSMAVLTNWIRVFVIVMAGYLTDMRHYLVTVDHYRFGWVLFAMMMAVFFFLASRMQQQPKVPHHESAVSALQVATSKRVMAAIVVVTIPALAFLVDYNVRRSPDIAFDTATLPPNWQVQTLAANDWSPKFINADVVSMSQIRRANFTVEIYRAGYRYLRQDGKLAAYNNSITGHSDGVEIVQQSLLQNGFNETIWQDSVGRRFLIWTKYFVGDDWFSHPIVGQMWYAVAAMVAPTSSGVVALRAACVNDCTIARHSLSELLVVMPLAGLLPVRTAGPVPVR